MGGANVLLRKPRISAECYNDLDGSIVNVFRVLQDPAKASLLARQLSLTPFARAEYDESYGVPSCEIDAAAKTIVRSFFGFGSDTVSATRKMGFRSKMHPSHNCAAVWGQYYLQVDAFVERFRGVTIEQRDACEVIERIDRPKALFYVDPPYVLSTRSSKRGGGPSHAYRHEMRDEDHSRLARVLHGVRGMVLLSGYQCDLYDRLYGDWECRKIDVFADGARPREECLWLNRQASQGQQRMCFGEAVSVHG